MIVANNMNIGIFLGYGPQVVMNKEGLGRYIAGLMSGFIANGNQVTIACPNWLLGSVECLCNDFGIPLDKIKFIKTNGNPVLCDVYNLWQKRQKNKLQLRNIQRFYMENVYKKLMSLPKVRSKASFLLQTFIYAAFIFIIAFPACAICVIFLLKWLGKAIVRYLKKDKQHIRLIMEHLNIRHVDLLLMLFSKMYALPSMLLSKMCEREAEILVSKINGDTPQDVWFVPALFWPQVCRICRGTVVINAPDLVSEQFPIGFADVYNADNAIEDCRKTLREGRYFITYCGYVKQVLLMEKYSKADSHVLSMPHVNNSMLKYINIGKDINEQIGIKKNLNSKFSHILLNIAKEKSSMYHGYAHRMNMSSVKYIFYASQYRPSKNIMNLLKAYEYLLHDRFIHHKLFLTVSRPSPEMKKYIKANHLMDDVICFAGVSAQILAALYYCADLVVNPTLYEGGFPFTFGEGMSVGTPSIMSDIPQVREVFEPAGLENMLFNPYSWKDIAKKIEWGLSNANLLYEKQLKLYNAMEKRTYDTVAEEYEKAFNYFISIDGR